jgi:catechol 2,3-dioxygenase-like lactoylglutathione lyase family enzyme
MKGEETKNWKFDHAGLIVADLEKTVEYYRSLGIFDFSATQTQPYDSPAWDEYNVYGKSVIKGGQAVVPQKPGEQSARFKFCRLGSMKFEIIQPGRGILQDLNGDFLDKAGDGISHVCYMVDGEYFEQEVEKMKAKGLKIILSGEIANISKFVYFDARKFGGLVIELETIIKHAP